MTLRVGASKHFFLYLVSFNLFEFEQVIFKEFNWPYWHVKAQFTLNGEDGDRGMSGGEAWEEVYLPHLPNFFHKIQTGIDFFSKLSDF